MTHVYRDMSHVFKDMGAGGCKGNTPFTMPGGKHATCAISHTQPPVPCSIFSGPEGLTAQECRNRTLARNMAPIWDGIVILVLRKYDPGNFDIIGTNILVYL